MGTRRWYSEAGKARSRVWGMYGLFKGKHPIGSGHIGREVKRQTWASDIIDIKTATVR